jgi:hypothetical protein
MEVRRSYLPANQKVANVGVDVARLRLGRTATWWLQPRGLLQRLDHHYDGGSPRSVGGDFLDGAAHAHRTVGSLSQFCRVRASSRRIRHAGLPNTAWSEGFAFVTRMADLHHDQLSTGASNADLPLGPGQSFDTGMFVHAARRGSDEQGEAQPGQAGRDPKGCPGGSAADARSGSSARGNRTRRDDDRSTVRRPTRPVARRVTGNLRGGARPGRPRGGQRHPLGVR